MQAHVTDLRQQLQSALMLRCAVPLRQRDTHHVLGKAERGIVARSFGDLQRLVELAHRGVVGEEHPVAYPEAVLP